MLKRVNEINWNDDKYIRSGIIPYIDINNSRFYAFGIANIVGDLCDFGGHREIIDNDLLDTAIREYQEESLNIFGILNRKMLENFNVLEGKDTIEILLPVSGSLYYYSQKFQELINGNKDHELQNIVWLSYDQFNSGLKLINGVNIIFMYEKIRDAFNISSNYKSKINQSSDLSIYVRTYYLLYLTYYNDVLNRTNINGIDKTTLKELINMGFFKIKY